MAEDVVRVLQTQTKPIKLLKWKVRLGYTIAVNRLILTYAYGDQGKSEQHKLKADRAGTIHKFWAQEGQVVEPGEPLYEIKECQHPTIMNDMCAECGADLRKDDSQTIATASVPMIHAIPDLKVSEEQAQMLGKLDNDRLIRDRKLVLLVDLDQTLIHTTNDNIPPNIKDVCHFQLYGPRSPWYHTRLRPGTHEFLENVSKYYELHICTFGARNYAHTIALFLDPDQKFFSNRILSRDECFDPTSKKANLRALFPCGDDMVCIIDDREDVWNHALNLIHVKPYHFFQHTGDINAPPGLDKHEDDEILGCDLTKIKSKKKSLDNTVDTSKSNEGENEEIKSSHNNQDVIEDIKNDKNYEEENEVSSSSDNKDVLKLSSEENNMDMCKCMEESEAEADSTEIIEDDLKRNNSESTVTSESNVEGQKDSTGQENSRTENGDAEEENSKEADKKKSKNIEPKQVNCENNEKVSIENNGQLKIVDQPNTTENLIEIEDSDDYLHYLQDILYRIHISFYTEFDKMNSGEIPDLKDVIPRTRSQILKGTKLCFSGLVPTRCRLEQSKAYQVAVSLGAQVSQDLENDTTHLVAVRPGTIKVNSGKRRKYLKIVTPDWLWCCAERWEHVDERVFPVTSKVSKSRHPPPHCSSPKHTPSYPEHDTPALRKRTPSGRFMDTINPLMSFSSDEIANMDKEVEDILDDDESDSDAPVIPADGENIAMESSDSETEESFKRMIQSDILSRYDKDENGSSSEEGKERDNETGDEKEHQRKRKLDDLDLDESSQEESPMVKFRRGGELDNDALDLDPERELEDPDSEEFEVQDDMDDKEWNMMGAALEREFLSD